MEQIISIPIPFTSSTPPNSGNHTMLDPTTPHPSKKRIRLTPDGKHILIPLSNASGPIQILKIALPDLQPLPLVPVDRQ